MGFGSAKTFSEEGVLRLYQFFLIEILLLFYTFLTLALTFVGISGMTSTAAAAIAVYVIFLIIVIISILVVFSDFLRYFLVLIVIVCFLLGIFIGIFALVIQLMIYGILLFLLIWGITYMLIGRNDFNKKHKIFAITGFALALSYFILFIINAILTIITTQIVMASIFQVSSIASQNILIISILSIVIPVIGNLAFLLFVYNLTDRKILLIIAFVLGILSPFSAGILGIISLILFMLVYKKVYDDLMSESKKSTLMVPCPFCNRDIPSDSKFCAFCTTKFQQREEEAIDPRLVAEPQKREFNPDETYIPLEGFEKKQLVKYLLIAIIVMIIIAVAAVSIFMFTATTDVEKFQGRWRANNDAYPFYTLQETNYEYIEWKFLEDGTLEYYCVDQEGLPIISTKKSIEWTISDNYITISSDELARQYTYEFSPDNSFLSLYQGEDILKVPIYTFNRIS